MAAKTSIGVSPLGRVVGACAAPGRWCEDVGDPRVGRLFCRPPEASSGIGLVCSGHNATMMGVLRCAYQQPLSWRHRCPSTVPGHWNLPPVGQRLELQQGGRPGAVTSSTFSTALRKLGSPMRPTSPLLRPAASRPGRPRHRRPPITCGPGRRPLLAWSL